MNEYIQYLASFSKHASRINEQNRLHQYQQIDSFINLHNTQRYLNYSGNIEGWQQSIYKLASSSSSSSSSSSRSDNFFVTNNTRSTYFLRHNQFSDLSSEELSVMFSEPTHIQPPTRSVYKHSQHVDSEEDNSNVETTQEYNYIYYLSSSSTTNTNTNEAVVVKSSIAVPPATVISKRSGNGRQLRDSNTNFVDSLNWATSNNPKNKPITSYVRNQGIHFIRLYVYFLIFHLHLHIIIYN